jgi:hypothetical protein
MSRSSALGREVTLWEAIKQGTSPGRRRFAQSLHPHADDMSLLELREENEQLRDLVIQLSRIVVKNAVDRK